MPDVVAAEAEVAPLDVEVAAVAQPGVAEAEVAPRDAEVVAAAQQDAAEVVVRPDAEVAAAVQPDVAAGVVPRPDAAEAVAQRAKVEGQRGVAVVPRGARFPDAPAVRWADPDAAMHSARHSPAAMMVAHPDGSARWAVQAVHQVGPDAPAVHHDAKAPHAAVRLADQDAAVHSVQRLMAAVQEARRAGRGAVVVLRGATAPDATAHSAQHSVQHRPVHFAQRLTAGREDFLGAVHQDLVA